MRMAIVRRASLCLVMLGVVMAFFSCRVFEPANRPLDACRRSCEQRAKQQCTAAMCERGCEFIIDRIVEGEGENVIRCVASGPRRCTDVVWADCAARVGPHADGGPPGPPPPMEDD